VIVRVMGEGQWHVDEETGRRLNELDEEVGRAVESGDEDALRRGLRLMADMVRESGVPLPDAELASSDAIVPPEDLSLDEARELLTGEGLIPDFLG
jgi:PspA-Associated protein